MTRSKRTALAINVAEVLSFSLIWVLFYSRDFASWSASFFSYPWLGTSILALMLVVLGAFGTRKMLGSYAALCIGKSWKLGILALVSSLGLYLCGSYSLVASSSLRFESSLLLVVTFVFLCYDWRIIKSTFPLFLILGMSFPSPLLFDFFGNATGVFLSTVVLTMTLFLLFARMSTASVGLILVAPIIATGIALVYFLLPGTIYSTSYLIPLAVLVYAYSPLRGRIFNPNLRETNFFCPSHRAARSGFGFCGLCGRKAELNSHRPSLRGLVGIVLVALALVSLSLVQIPALVFPSGGFPQYNVYSLSGLSSPGSLPSSATSWLGNSSASTTATLSLNGDVYASKTVFDLQSPSSSNYTMYYELSAGSRANLSNAWVNIIGWKKATTTMNIGGLAGSLTVFGSQSKNETIVVYTGKEQLTFVQGYGGGTRTLTATFTLVRAFDSDESTSVAASIFLSDLQSNWSVMFQSIDSASSWSQFSLNMYGLFLSTLTLLATITSSGLVIFGAFLAMRGDAKTDEFLMLASSLGQMEWLVLSTMIESRARFPLTGEDIKTLIENRTNHPVDITRLLEKLEQIGLVKKALLEQQGEVLLGWRTTVRFGLV